jgi:hypothetical protein
MPDLVNPRGAYRTQAGVGVPLFEFPFGRGWGYALIGLGAVAVLKLALFPRRQKSIWST